MIDKKYFESVISPIKEDEFFKNYWNKKFLYVEGDTNKFSHLLSWEKINHLLEYQRMNYPRLRLVKDGVTVKPENYFEFTDSHYKNAPQIQRLKFGKVSEYLRQGNVLIIDAISEAIPEIYKFTRNFEWRLGDRVQSNCYIAWNQSEGFDTHWDNHDVFVIQILGSKKWRIYGQTRKAPLRYENLKHEAPKKAIWEKVISAGDIIYLPRGCWHDAIAVDGPTVHISIGVHKLKGHSYLKWLSNELLQNPIVRSDIPRERTFGNQKQFFEELKKSVLDNFTYESFVQYLAQSDGLVKSPLGSSLPFSVNPNQNIKLSSIVRLNSRRQLNIFCSNGTVRFKAHKKNWEFHNMTLPIFERLNLGTEITVEELLTDQINENKIIPFIKKLIEMNLIHVVNS